NVTPFKVVGVFECDGPFESEVWGDFDRMLSALERSGPNRVVGVLADPSDVEAFDARLQSDPQTPATVRSERRYLASQTGALTIILAFLGGFLGLVMGIAAVFTATNTMLSAVAA
ncbi:MAG: ABC transporter permease, partial [Bacteroidota bacterium]